MMIRYVTVVFQRSVTENSYSLFCISETFQKIKDAHGFIGIICNNAGIYVADDDLGVAAKCIDVNLVSLCQTYFIGVIVSHKILLELSSHL